MPSGERLTTLSASGFSAVSHKANPALPKPFFCLDKGLQRRVLEVWDRAAFQDHHLRVRLSDQRPNPLANPGCVGERHSALRTHDQQARNRFVLWMVRGQRAEHIGAGLPSHGVNMRMVRLVEQRKKGDGDRDQNATQGAQKYDASAGRQCPQKFRSPHLQDGAKARQTEQRNA